MRFENTKYEMDNGLIIRLRTDVELNGLMGTVPTGATDLGIHGIINGNRSREFGVHPRGVTLYRERGTDPDIFKSYKFLPVVTPADLAGAGFSEGTDITISGVVWTVQDKVTEEVN